MWVPIPPPPPPIPIPSIIPTVQSQGKNGSVGLTSENVLLLIGFVISLAILGFLYSQILYFVYRKFSKDD